LPHSNTFGGYGSFYVPVRSTSLCNEAQSKQAVRPYVLRLILHQTAVETELWCCLCGYFRVPEKQLGDGSRVKVI